MCVGFESTFAPTSRITDIFSFMFGNAAASAGRSTEGSVPITNRATVITAPVFPALTSASAFPSRTSRAATCTELSFFRRNACDGESVMVITSVAFTTSIAQVALLVPRQLLPHRGLDAHQQHAHAQLTCRQDRSLDFNARRMVAAHGIQGNGSHVDHRLGMAGEGNLGRLGLGVNHFAAVVVAALRTRPVGQLLFVAIRAFGQRQRMQMVVRAAGRCAPLRVSSFRIGHSCSSCRPRLNCGLDGIK